MLRPIESHKVSEEVDVELTIAGSFAGSATVNLPMYTVHPASMESVSKVMNSEVGGDNGRSEWVWIRIPNGDLILGVFPRGDTYFDCEEDADYPGK